MQAHVQPAANSLAKKIKIEVRTESGRWQQPEIVRLQHSLALVPAHWLIHRDTLPERGVRFSLLND